ncbi:MAG: hypothetical protein R6V12_16745 [Candidatus Hydrogenedentota bacterium]
MSFFSNLKGRYKKNLKRDFMYAKCVNCGSMNTTWHFNGFRVIFQFLRVVACLFAYGMALAIVVVPSLFFATVIGAPIGIIIGVVFLPVLGVSLVFKWIVSLVLKSFVPYTCNDCGFNSKSGQAGGTVYQVRVEPSAGPVPAPAAQGVEVRDTKAGPGPSTAHVQETKPVSAGKTQQQDSAADIARKAHEAVKRGEYTEAAKRYTHLIHNGHQKPSLYYALGYCYYKLGRHGECHSLLQKAATEGHEPAQKLLEKLQARGKIVRENG